jgi:hypothetical protein
VLVLVATSTTSSGATIDNVRATTSPTWVGISTADEVCSSCNASGYSSGTITAVESSSGAGWDEKPLHGKFELIARNCVDYDTIQPSAVATVFAAGFCTDATSSTLIFYTKSVDERSINQTGNASLISGTACSANCCGRDSSTRRAVWAM